MDDVIYRQVAIDLIQSFSLCGYIEEEKEEKSAIRTARTVSGGEPMNDLIDRQMIAELDKLEEYLKKNNIPYKRVDEGMRRHQILVPEEYPNAEWDAICQLGSYGYEDGLLEIMGDLVDEEKDGDTVVGYLTAEDVVKRIEERRK